MGKITLITGGARSGKSRFAEELLKGEDNVLYVATGIAFDDEMKDRIVKHREGRNEGWETVEAHRNLDSVLENIIKDKKYILIDCLTLMVSNLMVLNKEIDWDKTDIKTANGIEKEIQTELENILKFAKEFLGEIIIVTNEIGMGVVPPTPLGRYYRDIAGRMNQIVAEAADNVYFLVSGIPVKIKG